MAFDNGILHKLSNPLSPPEVFFTAAARLNLSAISKLPAPFVGSFEAITGVPDTTLFTITNEALEIAMAANRSANTLSGFIDDLAYYVVNPGVYFENAFTGQVVQSLNGVNLKLAGFGTGETMVNDAIVVRSDIFTANGVLHVLDRYASKLFFDIELTDPGQAAQSAHSAPRIDLLYKLQKFAL